MWGSEIRLWFVCFLCKALPKILKLNEVNMYLFKFRIKRIALVKRVKSVQSQQLRHKNHPNFVVLVSLLLTLNIFYALFYNRGQN